MSVRLCRIAWVLVLILLFHVSSRRPEHVFAAGNSVSTPSRFSSAFGRLPIAFEPNRGQADPQIQFVVQQWNAAPVAAALGRRGELHVASADGGTSVQTEMEGANPAPEIQTAGRLPGRYNYFESRDPRRWIHGIPSYGQVQYCNVYPGIDLTYSGRSGRLEYDWAVAAGADPAAIRLSFSRQCGRENQFRRRVGSREPERVAASAPARLPADTWQERIRRRPFCPPRPAYFRLRPGLV